MQARSSLTLNTSLKNARIFDEHPDDDSQPLTFEKLLKQHEEASKIKIKTEPVNEKHIKTEPKEDLLRGVKFDLSSVKVEKEDDGICISSAVAEMQLLTPVKKEEDDSKVNLKSAKRSLLKQRNSPYAKEMTATYATRSTTTILGKEDNLYEQLEKTKRKLLDGGKLCVIESNPEVLTRRQKQIDFGKNTMGYDNYIKAVPKNERKPDDPMTPNKHRVYSRRGFDGLIKQWRLKLHKYDAEKKD